MERKELPVIRRLDGVVLLGLGIALLLVLILSPFSSPSPDGLERVAETKGFAGQGESWKFWKYAPLTDYAIPGVKNEKASTALSGLIGTLAIFFIAFGLGKLIKKIPTKKLILLIFFFSLISFSSTTTCAIAARVILAGKCAWSGEFAGINNLTMNNRKMIPSQDFMGPTTLLPTR
jgi:cobalt/nickel transport protein